MSDIPQALKIIKKSLLEQIAEKIMQIKARDAVIEKCEEKLIEIIHRQDESGNVAYFAKEALAAISKIKKGEA